MKTALTIAQIVLPIVLITAILLQTRGTGLGAGFGGEGQVFRTKRGVEAKLHKTTIVLAVLFFIAALLEIFIG